MFSVYITYNSKNFLKSYTPCFDGQSQLVYSEQRSDWASAIIRIQPPSKDFIWLT